MGESARGRVWWVPWIAVALVGLAALALALAAHPRAASAVGTVSVTGEGSVQAAPDTLSFQIGVSATAPTAAAALGHTNSRLASVEAVLFRTGVRRADVQTSNVSVNDNTNATGAIVSFTANDMLTVSTHDMSHAGAILDAAARAAGNEVQLYGVNYSLSQQSRAMASARQKAMRDAGAAAGNLARAGGARLGRVLSISEQQNSWSYPVPAGEAFAFKGAHVPLQSGSQTVSVQVKVVYALND